MSVGRARQNRLENILKYTYHFASQTDNKLPCKIKLAHTVPLVCGRLVNRNGSVEKNGYCATEHEGSKLNFFDKSLRPKSQQSSYETKFAGASIVPGYKQICQTPRETVSFGRFPFSQNFRNFWFGGKWNTFRQLVPLENSQKKWKI